MQLMKTFSAGDKSAKVYWNREWEEYVVRFYAGKIHMDASDYHTTCKDDAYGTAEVQINDERQWHQREGNYNG